MNDLTGELLSRYADGEVTADERREVEGLLESDPAAVGLLEELGDLNELFVPTLPREGSDDLKQRLYQLGRTTPLTSFKPLPREPGGRSPWALRWGALAAAILIGVGIGQLTHRAPVVVRNFTRQTLGPDGRVVKTERLETVTMRAGDALRARTGERVSARLPGGCLVVLVGDSAIRLGDPAKREVFTLDRGTALCTVTGQQDPRIVRAGEITISADQAYFGVRVKPAGTRSAGPSGRLDAAEVAVAVSRGSLTATATKESRPEQVAAGDRVIFFGGGVVERSEAWRDVLYVYLMRHLRVGAREVVPGFFEGEPGLLPIAPHSWARGENGSRVLVLTRQEGMATARFLVLYARASRPTRLHLTRVRPYRDAANLAETVTVETAEVKTDWTLLTIPRTAFDEPAKGVRIVSRKERRIPAGRSRLMRLELRPGSVDSEITFELKSSLWAARPPAEEIR